jgi:hypothetical protein
MAKKASLHPNLKQLLEKGNQIYQTGISVDCVIFGFHENVLKILVLDVQYINKKALPGGFIKINEPVEEAVIEYCKKELAFTISIYNNLRFLVTPLVQILLYTKEGIKILALKSPRIIGFYKDL